MLKRFEVCNYKNFKDKLTIDFCKVGGYQFNKECVYNGVINKMLIYGRNATGKTNLGDALMDIWRNMFDLHFLAASNGVFLNADSKDKMALFEYTFQFDENEVVYKYQKPSEVILYDEELIVNGRRAFYFNFEKKLYDFHLLDELKAETVVIDRYLEVLNSDREEDNEGQMLPFLRWIISNVALTNDSILLQINDYINRMAQITISSSMSAIRAKKYYDSFYNTLAEGEGLKDFEEFLNYMGIECTLVMRPLPDGQKELYFKHNTLIPFLETASSGTLTLLSLYRRLVMGRNASLLYLDEFDAFYHYEMSMNTIRFFITKYPNCQIVMTTHNTNLMTNRLLRPDCLFILSQRGFLTALCDATERELREGHNLEKMYISGEFEKYE